MGSFRFRRSIRLGPGVRMSLSKSGIGASFGTRGARYSVHSSGRRTTSVGIPGTGLGYVSSAGSGRRRRVAGATRTEPAVVSQSHIRPGLFAPGHEKEFAKALDAYVKGDKRTALEHFRSSSGKDATGRAIADDLLAGVLSLELGECEQAIPYLETVVASEIELPDQLMKKYGVTGHLGLNITEFVQATVPCGSLAAALGLVECYQAAGRLEEALGVLQQIATEESSSAITLSLCDLYAETGAWDEIVEVAAGVSNDDDLTMQIRLYQARALREQGLSDAALEAYRDALRSKKRSPALLLQARYERGKLLLGMGKTAQGKKDLEIVYAADPKREGLAELVGRGAGE